MSWFDKTNFGDRISSLTDYLIHQNGVLLVLAICYVLYGLAELFLLVLGEHGRVSKTCRYTCHVIVLTAIFTLAAIHGLEYGHATSG